MFEEFEEYAKYFERLNEVCKPLMPSFDISAYTDNEYINEISSIQNDFDRFDDFDLTLKYLKGE